MVQDDTSNVSRGHAFLSIRVISCDATTHALPAKDFRPRLKQLQWGSEGSRGSWGSRGSGGGSGGSRGSG